MINSQMIVSRKKIKLIVFLIYLFPLTVYAQVGINTEKPTNSLDINGDLRIRETEISQSTDDATLVVDASGVVKRSITDLARVKGYLNTDYPSGSASINKITDLFIVEDPKNDFNTSTNTYTPTYSGIYSVSISITATPIEDIATSNSVFGLVDGATGTWIVRSSVPKTVMSSMGLNNSAGIASTYLGVVSLTKGKSYYFGISKGIKLISHPTGNTGTGIGSYFSIELTQLKED